MSGANGTAGRLTRLEYLRTVSARIGGELAQVAGSAAEAVEELAGQKADIVHAAGITIPASGWASGSGSSEFPVFLDIPAPVSDTDVVAVDVLPDGAAAERAAGLGAVESRTAVLRFLARRALAADISAQYRIIGTTKTENG